MSNLYKKSQTQLSYKLLKVVSTIAEIEQKARNYGTDVPLYDAEIHMIKAIGLSKTIHVTGLAEKLGVTKGAVSQILMKLEKKGMILKAKDENNQSKLAISLTTKGEIAFQNHEKLHLTFNTMVSEALAELTETEKAAFMLFLNSLEEKLNLFNEN